MKIKLMALPLLALLSTTAHAADNLAAGFTGALVGCEEWVQNPASWSNGLEPYLATVGLGSQMGLVEKIDEVAMPPKDWRRGDHFWRINSTPTAGFILVVSDQLPICHITGGGQADMQPVIESVLKSDLFRAAWTEVSSQEMGDMISTVFASQKDPTFIMTITRAAKAGARQDRVQVLASASLETSK